MLRVRRGIGSIMVLAVVVLAGCSAGGEDRPPSSPEPSSALPVSPLVALTDPTSDEFLAADVVTVLDAQGEGDAMFTLAPPEGTGRVTFYVACAPASEFILTMDGSWFSGQCAGHYQNSGGIPLTTAGEVPAELELPAGTSYWVVAVPTET